MQQAFTPFDISSGIARDSMVLPPPPPPPDLNMSQQAFNQQLFNPAPGFMAQPNIMPTFATGPIRNFRKRFPVANQTAVSMNSLFCQTCNVQCCNGVQYQKHLLSDKHQRHVAPPKVYSCDVCDITCTGAAHLNAHMEGTKHKKKLASKTKIAELVEKSGINLDNLVSSSTSNANDSEMDSSHGPYYCQVCTMDCSSDLQFKQHILGKKHRYKAIASKLRPIKAQMAHTNAISCSFETFQPCYLEPANAEEISEAPEVEDLLEAEKELLEEYKVNDNFRLRLSCMHGCPSPLRLLRVPGNFKSSTVETANETDLLTYAQAVICSHSECAQKRALAFYYSWLEFQKKATRHLLDQKRKMREQRLSLKRAKLDNSQETDKMEESGEAQ